MRIITGTARGTKLVTLEGEATRPTIDKVKEALFSMIQFDIEGRNILDLFAGSGQLGLEALSRGAAKATFIDESRQAVDVVIENAKKTHLFDKCRISASGAIPFLKSAAGKESYDIVFLDPPYGSDLLAQALKQLSDGKVLAPGAIIVCECDTDIVSRRSKVKKDDEASVERVLEEVFGGDEETMAKYSLQRTAVYGRARITLLNLADEEE
ncbi:MAG: 16S rRNA (guanine(966)-N(2))-methyltransferase RsmD [Ruminococcaceae bacterium]|nr:16S rRNA (guanine(966)-N(2))-methyltransferase RsmD [Oscillospiraceae bacterium]